MSSDSEKKWYQGPVRMMRLDYEFDKVAGADLEQMARSKRDDWRINCEWIVGTPGYAPGLANFTTFDTPRFEKYPPLGDFDFVRSYLPHAQKHGIHVLAYLNMHWFSYEFASIHPDWEQLAADGTPYGRIAPLYGGGTTLCVNSGWRDWAMEMIAEAMKTGIEGTFLDGPLVYPGCCYCVACKTKFAKRYGTQIPAEEDWTDQRWLDFVQFRSDSLAEFLADARTAVRSVNLDGVVFLNAGTWRAGEWRAACNIDTLGDNQDFNSAEAFFYPGPASEFLYPWSAAAKHLMAGNKPAVVFSHLMLGPWHYVALPPIESQMAIAQTVACGANTWFAIMNPTLEFGKEQAAAPVNEIHSFIEEHEDCFCSTESGATVALLLSHQSGNYYLSRHDNLYYDAGSGQEQNLVMDRGSGEVTAQMRKRKEFCETICDKSYMGYFAALTREHIPFDVILDKDLTVERLADYKVLVLANSACISDCQIAAVSEFVRQGGGLVAEFEAGMYREQGKPREDSPLHEVVGVASLGGVMKPAAAEEYIKVKGTHPVTESLTDGQLLPRPQFAMSVEKVEPAGSPVIFMNEIGKTYAPLKGESTIPAVVTNTFGLGRTTYIPGLAGRFYWSFKIHEYQKLIGNAVRWTHNGPLPVDVDCPQTVEVELRHQADPARTLIHLVNCTGDMQRPLSEIIPLKSIGIRIRQKDVRNVTALRARIDLEFTQDEGVCEFTLPDLGIYEVIKVEPK